jgi:CRP-like cAMP-binding protein
MSPDSHLLIRKLEGFATLSDSDKRALDGVVAAARTSVIAADRDIVPEGERMSDCALILEGFACRYTILQNGRRQIMSFHIPGDICDLHGLLMGTLDHGIGTLTATTVALIPHASLNDLIRHYPDVARALWQDTLVDGAVFRAWMVGMGRRSATGRIAHLLCELFVRFKTIGLTSNGSLAMPTTQAELADSLGLSTVHVNRVLQELRRDGLITLRGGTLVIEDWEGLQEAGEFDAGYLHVDDDRQGGAHALGA